MKIYTYGEKVLRKKCRRVDGVSEKERKLFLEMQEQMKQSGGVGLAACQVGLDVQLIVVEFEGRTFFLANPKIIKAEGRICIEEGCLSVPGVSVKVERREKIEVEALDESNKKVNVKSEGVLSIIFQHEIDHLRGKLIIDYLPFAKRVKTKLKLQRHKNEKN